MHLTLSRWVLLGTLGASSLPAFAAAGYESPYIQSFAPASGAPGTVITVNGSGFTGLTAAWIGTGHDSVVSVVSDSVAKVTVPTDATTGQVALLNPENASWSPNDFTVSTSTNPPPPPPSKLSVRVEGNHLIDAKGNLLQLRGVNASGLESVAVQGWSPANPWGAPMPQFNTMSSTWGVNAVRMPLNESSWLGLTCEDVGGAGWTMVNGVQTTNAKGTMVHADPGGNYKSTVLASVAAANAAGLYVILDLHWAAPGTTCPFGQNPFVDSSNSIDFWESIAGTFGYPNGSHANQSVIFEAFNEPFMFWLTPAATNPWSVLKNGGTFSQLFTFGNPYQVSDTWQAPGMQQLVNAIRGTGAVNPILTSGLAWSGDLSQWLAEKPSDPLNQLGAVWHAYPGYGAAFGSPAYIQPNNAVGDIWTEVQGIVSAGYPVVITEFGDQDTAGTTTAPFASNLLPWADKNLVSYLGWTWDVWQNPSNVLISDAAGAPSPGYGVYVKAHYLCRAAGTAVCK